MSKHGIINKLLYGEPVLNLSIYINYDEEFRDKFKKIQERENARWSNLLKDAEKCYKITKLIEGEKYVTNEGYLFPGNFHNLDRIVAKLNMSKNFKELIRLSDEFNENFYYWDEKLMVELNTTKYQGKFHIININSKLWIPEFNNF